MQIVKVQISVLNMSDRVKVSRPELDHELQS